MKLNKYFGIAPNLKGKKLYTTFKDKANEDDEDDDKLFAPKQLGYFTQTQTSTCIVIPIDEPVKDTSYYRQVVQAISSTGEGDQIQFEIHSPGGHLSGLIALLTAMCKTDATKVAHINGDAHSAASMLALNCDSIYVSPYASMLVHFVSFGSSGKATDIKSHVNHVHNTSEMLFRETYELFLTEEEIERCIGGFELWLDYEEITRRLEYKYSVLQAREDEFEVLEPNEETDKTEVGSTFEDVCGKITTGSIIAEPATEIKPSTGILRKSRKKASE